MAIFEAVVVLIIILLSVIVIKSNWESRKSSIPGLTPTDPMRGNFGDIELAGSLHEFLLKLHNSFGDIASFWMGTQMVVSIASPELFRQHSRSYNRPLGFSDFMKPFLSENSIQLMNGQEAKKRRKMTDLVFSHSNVNQAYLPIFLQNVEDLAMKWKSIPKDEHIPLMESLNTVALKSILEVLCGKYSQSHHDILKWKNVQQVFLQDMERAFQCSAWEDKRKQHKEWDYNIQTLVELFKQSIGDLKGSGDQGDLLVDVLLRHGEPDEVIVADAITYLIGGSSTTGLLMAWLLYYLAVHEDVQERCHRELKEVLQDGPLTEDMKDLVYSRQVINEALRCGMVTTLAARCDDEDLELGGYNVPAGTPVMHALGVVLQNERIWENATRFDPERFCPANKRKLQPYTFEPFGFAGRRKCPGYRYAYVETTAMLSVLLREFKIKLVPGQKVTKVYGFATRPKEEIWITIEARH